MRLTYPALAGALGLLAGCRCEPAPPATTPSRQLVAVAASASMPAPGAVKPVSGHPRMWLTAEDLPRLRGWASPGNPMYAQGLRRAVDEAIATYDKDFFPGGKPNPTWPDPGIDNWVGKCTEAYAEIFAFMSLVDPDPAARKRHAARARNLLMHVIDEAAKGVDADRQNPAPFRSSAFSTYNRANFWGEAFGLTVDWIYPVLSAADKATLRKVFMRWASENVVAATSSNEHPEPVGLLDDPRLIADTKRLRWAANNYFTGHMRQLTLLGLSLDAVDDPPLDPAAPPGKLGNTLKSYLDDAIGAWLYQQYAMYEDPAVSSAALGVPAAGLGAASGGLPPEGFLYGVHIAALHESLLALYTAGYRDPRALGPQIRMIDSGYWDRLADGLLHSIVPAPSPLGYHGSVYQMANYGDTLRFWMTPDQMKPFASLAVYDTLTGNARRLEKARWIAGHVVEGGMPRLFERAAQIWGNADATVSILSFMMFDPAAPAPQDPRPALPRVFLDRALGRVLARTDWTPGATMFSYKCGWMTIGHQLGDCNQFELYRKGEWLTKERSGYANDLAVMTSEFHNTLGLQNAVAGGADKPTTLQWFEAATWARGGQWTLGASAGDPRVLTSVGPTWVAAQGDATDLYNRTQGPPGDHALDVVHASRSIVWLEPDQVVIYDRAATRSDGQFKRFNLITVGEPILDGKRVTVTTPQGQRLFVQSLLPADAVITVGPAETYSHVADGEPSKFRILVEDPRSPREVRFLHVLEGADAAGTPALVKVVQSSAGTAFTGALVGTSAVMFPVELSAPFTRVTYVVPKGTLGQLVTGLVPGSGYDVIQKAMGGAIEVTVAPGGALHADAAGVLALGALQPK